MHRTLALLGGFAAALLTACGGGSVQDVPPVPAEKVVVRPGIDVLVIPGGFGTRQLFDDVDVRDWIRQMSARAQLTTSVCTGALLLARAGLLSHRRATTHWGALDLLGTIDQTTTVERQRRVVQDVVFTSAGVAAGIDMALDVVESLYGRAVADETAKRLVQVWEGSGAGQEVTSGR